MVKNVKDSASAALKLKTNEDANAFLATLVAYEIARHKTLPHGSVPSLQLAANNVLAALKMSVRQDSPGEKGQTQAKQLDEIFAPVMTSKFGASKPIPTNIAHVKR